MLKILTCLALVPYVLSVNSGTNHSNDNHLCNDVPIKSAYQSNTLIGEYNWCDTVDLSGIEDDIDFTITFETDPDNDYRFQTPIWIGYSANQEVYEEDFIISIRISYSSGNEIAAVDFYNFTYDNFRYHDYFTIEDGNSIDEFYHNNNNAYKSLIFYIRESYTLSTEQRDLFGRIFTTQDNDYVTTYSGYYSFQSNISNIYYPLGVYGHVSFSNRIYYGFTNTTVSTVENNQIRFSYFEESSQEYAYNVVQLPINKNDYVVNNMLLTSCKMSYKTYENLGRVGTLGYVRPVQDDSDLKDLLFTIADTPVYFVSQFLNFDLFGFNLFLALSGILTILIAILVIKKVW